MMAAVAHLPLRLRRSRSGRRAAVRVPPLPPRQAFVRACLVIVCVTSSVLLLQLTVVSSIQQRATQQQLFDRFRSELANGTAPVGPTTAAGAELPIGAPVSYLQIPSIGLRQVVVEGTTGPALLAGPGHRRDTPLPGQGGVSVLMGRRASFGGPFSRISELGSGDAIRVTTSQGTFDYEVIGVRREGDEVPPPPDAGDARLVLTTADGPPYLPEGVLRVDAEMDGDAAAGPARSLPPGALPDAEQALGTDPSRLWLLVLWLQALLAGAVGMVWAWHLWGRAQAWVVFLPPLALASLYAGNGVTTLLPNLL